MRVRAIVATVAFVASSVALAEPPPRYVPQRGLLVQGYKHRVEEDGSLRVEAIYQSREWYPALNVAMYRAAELAREAGKPYVQILGARAETRGSVASAQVYARPTDDPAAPRACRKRERACYTADVAVALRELSGPDGTQPGVRRPSGTDELGRTVIHEGFGAGAVAWRRQQ